MFHDKVDPLIEISLVETIQIGQMDLEPPQATRAQRPRFAKHQQPTTQIVTNMI